jgi:hypothetical protein
MDSLEARARERAKALTDMLWHVGAFVIINGFMWLTDWFTDGRITWAYWVTVPWLFGLLFHGLTWLIQGRQIEEHFIAKYVAEGHARQVEEDHLEDVR